MRSSPRLIAVAIAPRIVIAAIMVFAGLHLFIHEFPESLAHVVRAFERKSEIVNCERNGSTHLVRAQSYRRRGRLGRNAFRGFSRRRGDSASRLSVIVESCLRRAHSHFSWRRRIARSLATRLTL